MRVLVVEQSGKGGLYTYTDALCAGLSQAGADVTVLTSSTWPQDSSLFKIERRLLSFTPMKSKALNLQWAADRFCRSTLNILRRNHFAVSGDFDVVHIQGITVPLFDRMFLKPLAGRVPLVATIHDVEPHYDRFAGKSSFLRSSMRIPARLIVHYAEGKRQLIDKWGIDGSRIDVIPHGIMPVKNVLSQSDARKSIGLPDDRKIVLFFGAIRPNKGLDVLLRAIDIVRRQRPDVLLVIAGEPSRGMSFEPYSQIINELKLSNSVRSFVQFVHEQDVNTFFSACDAVVMPYQKFEAQSGVLLRAYAHKKPVVVSNVGAMGELVSADKVGLVVEPAKPDVLAAAISNVLDNQDKFKAGYNPEIEDKYSWKEIAEQTLSTYKQAITAGTCRECFAVR
jgi:D-inositol-3-phosphate glycosyltransferase